VLQRSQIVPCGSDDTIIIGAVGTKHGNAPAAELQDKKGHGIECHSWEIGRRVVAVSQLLLFIGTVSVY